MRFLLLATTVVLLTFSASPAHAAKADEDCYQLTLQGRQARAAGDLPLALSIFQRAQGTVPTDARPYFWIAVCEDEMGQPQLALDAYEQCIAAAKTHDMDCAEMRVDLGNLLCRMKYYKQAIFDYRRAITIDPRVTIAHLYLARALIELGNWSQSLAELDTCTMLNLSEPSIPFLKALCLKETGKYSFALKEIETFYSTSSDAIKQSTLGQQCAVLQLQLQQHIQQFGQGDSSP
jgi:tetratricopeptide (TPR) repeat protein